MRAVAVHARSEPDETMPSKGATRQGQQQQDSDLEYLIYLDRSTYRVFSPVEPRFARMSPADSHHPCDAMPDRVVMGLLGIPGNPRLTREGWVYI